MNWFVDTLPREVHIDLINAPDTTNVCSTQFTWAFIGFPFFNCILKFH